MSGFVFPVLGHILTRGKLRGLSKEVLRGTKVEGLVIDLRGEFKVALVLAIFKEVEEEEEKEGRNEGLVEDEGKTQENPKQGRNANRGSVKREKPKCRNLNSPKQLFNSEITEQG